MTSSRGRRGSRSTSGRRNKSKPVFAGRRDPERGHTEPGSYRRGGFRSRRRILGIALLALVLVGTLLGGRTLLSSEAAVTSGNGPDQSSQQLEPANSQDHPGKNEGGAPEAASVETTRSKQTAKPPGTSGKTKLGEFRTDYRYSDSEARRYNLRTSSRAVDGTVLEPGEVFSMNDHIAGLDYKQAKVFADGSETLALGGGLCQVTSTVYMAAQYAGLEIIERNPHYTVLPYIRPSFDATVWFGGQGIPELDMRFKNTTDSQILIREYITDSGFLVAEIWGQPTGKEVEMRSEQVFRDLDRGIKWKTYKTVKENGEIIESGVIHTDLYSFPPPTEGSGEDYNEVRVGGWRE